MLSMWSFMGRMGIAPPIFISCRYTSRGSMHPGPAISTLYWHRVHIESEQSSVLHFRSSLGGMSIATATPNDPGIHNISGPPGVHDRAAGAKRWIRNNMGPCRWARMSSRLSPSHVMNASPLAIPDLTPCRGGSALVRQRVAVRARCSWSMPRQVQAMEHLTHVCRKMSGWSSSRSIICIRPAMYES